MLIVFVSGIDQTRVYGGCVTVSVLVHYFTLVMWMWMGAEAVHMYIQEAGHCVWCMPTSQPNTSLASHLSAGVSFQIFDIHAFLNFFNATI